jgi:Na+-translocating ferredoxin:NAD+ oxidoreductase RnfG subunit
LNADLIDVLSKFGLSIAIVAALAFWLYGKLWPFITEQLTTAQAARQAEIREFIVALERRDALAREMQRENMQALHAMTEELRSLRDTVRSIR